MPLLATTNNTKSTTKIDLNRLAKYGLVTVFVAIVANALIRVITLGLVDVPANFVPLPLGWGPVIVSSAVGAIGATVVYGALTRVSRRANRAFTIVAAVVLVLSFVPMLTLPPKFADAVAPVVPALIVMHVTVAAVSVGVLRRATFEGANAEGE